MPPALDRCVKKLKAKGHAEDSAYAICWDSIKKTHKKVDGKWVRMSDTREYEEELSFKIPADYKYIPPSKEEVAEAIKSVPAILDKERLIEKIDERVRLIKNLPVLTEGKFNRVNYSKEVLESGADSWNTNPDKPGTLYKVKLEHDKNVKNRAGHLLNSRFEDGYVKHDILLTTKESAEYWDGGHLDDVSVRMRVGIDKNNSSSEELNAKYVRGVGVDFVDNPACKQCGVNAELEAILKELKDVEEIEEDATMVEDQREEIELNEEEKTLFEKFKHFIGLEDEELPEEEEEEEEIEEEESLEDEDEGNEVTLEEVVAKVEELEGVVTELSDENKQLKAEKKQAEHEALVEKAMEYHAKLKEDVKKDEVEKLEDAVLEERISQLKLRSDQIPAHDSPFVPSSLTEDNSATQSRIEELQDELKKKGHQRT